MALLALLKEQSHIDTTKRCQGSACLHNFELADHTAHSVDFPLINSDANTWRAQATCTTLQLPCNACLPALLELLPPLADMRRHTVHVRQLRRLLCARPAARHLHTLSPGPPLPQAGAIGFSAAGAGRRRGGGCPGGRNSCGACRARQCAGGALCAGGRRTHRAAPRGSHALGERLQTTTAFSALSCRTGDPHCLCASSSGACVRPQPSFWRSGWQTPLPARCYPVTTTCSASACKLVTGMLSPKGC